MRNFPFPKWCSNFSGSRIKKSKIAQIVGNFDAQTVRVQYHHWKSNRILKKTRSNKSKFHKYERLLPLNVRFVWVFTPSIVLIVCIDTLKSHWRMKTNTSNKINKLCDKFAKSALHSKWLRYEVCLCLISKWWRNAYSIQWQQASHWVCDACKIVITKKKSANK